MAVAATRRPSRFWSGSLAPVERASAGWDEKHARFVAVAHAVARVMVAPLLVAYRLRLISYITAGELLSVLPGGLGLLTRRAWYEATLASCGKRLRLGTGTVIKLPGTRIGNDCSLGAVCRVGLAEIGHDFLAGDYVAIISGRHQHGYSHRAFAVRWQPGTHARVVVGDGVWAGSHAVIAADVADHSVVAAGAVVVEPLAEWSIIGGVPAKVIGERP